MRGRGANLLLERDQRVTAPGLRTPALSRNADPHRFSFKYGIMPDSVGCIVRLLFIRTTCMSKGGASQQNQLDYI